MKKKLQYFPLTSFAVVMGLMGLTIAFGKFYHLQWLPKNFVLAQPAHAVTAVIWMRRKAD